MNNIFYFYLDQNIWDLAIKKEILPLKIFINKTEVPVNPQYIYSHITLDEISRADDREQKKFLNKLKEDKAQYLYVEPKSEKARLEDIDPFRAFERFNENRKSDGEVQYTMQDLSYQLSAGKTDKSYSDILGSINNSIKTIFKDIDPQIKKYINKDGKSFEELQTELVQQTDYLTQQFSIILENHAKLIKGYPLKEIRKFLPFSAEEINNIPSNKIINELWREIKNSKLFNISDDDLDIFLENVFRYLYPKSKWSLLNKINLLYMALNYLGYWQDEKLEKRRKYISSLNDTSHAYYAAFSHFFITKDYRLVRKLQAVYHHFDIKTIVYHFKDQLQDKE